MPEVPPSVRRKAAYGIDAPYVPALLGLAAVAFVVAGIFGDVFALVIVGAVFALETAVFLHATLRGKFVVWERLLDDLDLRGDERVVDLGCGRGAVLIATARRLGTGRAYGVDVWRSIDQSGNDASVTLANVRAEGVADRVVLQTADVRRLPFAAASFDVVTSSIALHNLRDAADRSQAIEEAVRVLRPGGRLVIADLRFTAAYARQLRLAGFGGVRVTGAGPGFWFAGPWQGVKVVTATKPLVESGVAPDVTAES